MRRYFTRKIITYVVAFFLATTIDWAIPRIMPGSPVQLYISKFSVTTEAQYAALQKLISASFGVNVPVWKQYLDFWDGVLHWNFGLSFYATEPVTHVIFQAIPYTLALLIPAITLSYILGNRIGAMAARRKWLDNTVLPVGYLFQAAPYAWLALAMAYYLAARLHWFPVDDGYNPGLIPGWNWTFIGSLLEHWFLPFLTVFLVSFGGWAIGMRNLVIYELETDYARYLRSLGAPQRLVRKYAYRNAVLPQLSGLALSLGAVVGGNIVTEVVFQYPGLGHLIFLAISDEDYFLLQGIFMFIIVGVLLANFVIDIVYVIVDPRTRLSMQGAPGVSINTGPASAPEDFAGGTSVAPGGPATLAPSVGAGGAQLAAMAPGAGAGSSRGGRRWEFLHFALRNPKLMIGLGVELIFVAVAIFGPALAPYSPTYHGTPGLHPSAHHLFGTTYPFGTDVFSQVLYGVRDSYVVGALGALFAGAVGLVVGFAAGYRGGVLDEILQLFTNVMICIPQLVLLIVISAYLTTRGVLFEGIFIGVTGWPWVARAVRAQTFTLRERDFVDLARLSGRRAVSIVVKDIAPNMASYIFLVFVLLFASSMLVAVNFDFLGLGPTNGLSLGDIMNQSTLWSALDLHMWWWFIPPGAALTLMVLALYIANVGLDEVFNPKLRQT